MSICGECSKSGLGDCCHLEEGMEDYRFGLTLDDLRRVPLEGLELSGVPEDIIAEWEGIAPGSSRMFPHGIRIGPKFRGPCYFWSENGCTLPQEKRPTICLTFPAWPTPIVKDGKVGISIDPNGLAGERCLAMNTGKTFWEGWELLGHDREYVVQMCWRLHGELERHTKVTRKQIRRAMKGYF